MGESAFDQDKHKWRHVSGEPGDSYLVDHDYTILGYNQEAGTLDMVVRWGANGGHCQIHRHTATTTILVLEGEQHLWDLHKDGSKGEERIRKAGDYALTVGPEVPHLERGGDQGGLVFFGSHSDTGKLYDILDEDLNLVIEVTMELLIADFNADAK